MEQDNDKKTCYVCLEEDSNLANFIPSQPCKCKNLDLHINCFMKLNSKYRCSICKDRYQDFRFKIGNKVIRYFKYGIVENYFINTEEKKDGLYILKIEEEEILVHCFYKEDIRDGLSQEFYRNGNAKEHGYYVNGKRHGMHYKWFENRNLKEYREFKLGIPQGIQEFYQENGNSVLSYNIIDNKLDGNFKVYHLNGKIWIDSNFLCDMLDGDFKEYDDKGNLINSLKFERGTFIDLGQPFKIFKLIIDLDLYLKLFTYVMFILIFFK